MFKGLANFAQILKQAQQAQARMGEMKERLGRLTVQGMAGGGMVSIEMNGNQEVLTCRIEESLLRPVDREVIEDLVVAAFNDALTKLRTATMSEFSALSGGLDFEAMKDLLGGVSGE